LESWLEKIGKKLHPPEEKKGVLPGILASLDSANNKAIYTALNQAGFIRSGSEFMAGDNAL
jgi:hypothetical protein